MLRELVVNAIEAAAKAPLGDRLVEIKVATIEGFPKEAKKLCIWNTGPGMSSEQLDHICDLASSLNKDMKLDGNFGMGAKVASLPSNTYGIRYRSCHNGVVSQVILGKREGVYGKIRVEVENVFEDVVDVTDKVKEEGEYKLDRDWTEVVLFGNEQNQNTVIDPYNSDPRVDRQWVAATLYHRLYALPEGVEIFLDAGVHTRDGRRPLKPISARHAAFDRVETVDVGGGIKIHYFYDPLRENEQRNKSYSGALCTTPSNAALIYRDEMYDVRAGRKWTIDAPSFGIPFGGKHISVHVELPFDYPVRAEPYRRFIQLVGGDQRQLTVDDFADTVSRNRPQWLLDIIASLAPQPAAATDELKKELQELLNNLRVKAKSPRVTKDGTEAVDDGEGRGAEYSGDHSATPSAHKKPNSSPADLAFSGAGAKRANISKNLEQAPDIYPIREDEEIESHGIAGKAARYSRETNTLFVNMKYSAVEAIQEDLLIRYATHEDRELVQRLATETAEMLTMARVGRAVVFAQAKQLSRHWAPEEIKAALEPESLSIAADGWRDSMGVEYVKVSKRLGQSAAKLKALPTEKPEDLVKFH